MLRRTARSTVTTLALSAAFALWLGGCAGSGDDDDIGSNNDNNSNSDLGNDDAGDGNGQENFVDTDEGKGGNKDSADVNSATADAAAAPPANGALNATLDPGKDAPPANAAPANAAANGAGNAAAAGKGAAPAAGDATPVPNGRVRYVKEGGAQIVNAPNGSPVATLEQGDHPVTWEENGWLRITAGMYVPVDSLAEKGVPRVANPHAWQGGSGGDSSAAAAH